MSWRTNNSRSRSGIDGFMWIPDGPSSENTCAQRSCKCAGGATGPTGYSGLVGPTGPFGSSTGPLGPVGLVGASGLTGPQGLPGQAGVAGPTGVNGQIGNTGQQGDTGPDASAGNPGMTGPTGPDGAVGANGSDGPIGFSFTGPTGSVGPTDIGPMGPTGASPTGPTGPAISDITGPIYGPTGAGSTGFTMTGTDIWPVPPNVSLLTFELGGAAGEFSGFSSVPSGNGGRVISTFLNPLNGTVYTYYLGTVGGGGVGGVGTGDTGFAGGDLSYIYIGATPIMIAGGGGGAGTADISPVVAGKGNGGVGCTGSTSGGGFGTTGGVSTQPGFTGTGGGGGGGGYNMTPGSPGAAGGTGATPGTVGGTVNGGIGGNGTNDMLGESGGGGGGGNGYGGGGGGGGGYYAAFGGGGGAGGSYSTDPGALFSTSLQTTAYLNINWTYYIYTDPVLQYNVAGNYVYYGTGGSAKTFVIDHPIQTNKYLVHACLEGPDAGVYYRGVARIANEYKSNEYKFVEIYLADYVEHLATDFTVIVTPRLPNTRVANITFPSLMATRLEQGKFTVYSDVAPCEFDYLVFGKRQTIDTEPDKSATVVNGTGPYKWL